jgi:hypothetical protein
MQLVPLVQGARLPPGPVSAACSPFRLLRRRVVSDSLNYYFSVYTHQQHHVLPKQEDVGGCRAHLQDPRPEAPASGLQTCAHGPGQVVLTDRPGPLPFAKLE